MGQSSDISQTVQDHSQDYTTALIINFRHLKKKPKHLLTVLQFDSLRQSPGEINPITFSKIYVQGYLLITTAFSS